jgi:hypothetical protein
MVRRVMGQRRSSRAGGAKAMQSSGNFAASAKSAKFDESPIRGGNPGLGLDRYNPCTNFCC